MPLGKVESFHVGTQDWDAYVRRVIQFIALNNIERNLHVATLVTLVGADCYALMCDLCSPVHPEDKTFDELVKLVKDHLEPEQSEIAERHIFRQRKQQQGEGVKVYLQNLKHLAKTCSFGAQLEINLRDQFVSGLISEEMRSRLFAEKNIDYRRAVELALALEAAERHATTACATVAPGARALSDGAFNDDGLHRVGPVRGSQVAGGGSGNGVAGRRACARCGKGHPGRCRYRYHSCDLCGQKGHLKAMCEMQKRSEVSARVKQNRGQIYFNNSTSESENDCHFYNIISGGDEGPYYALLNINNASHKFEIDTGSKISAISQQYYNKFFSIFPIQSKTLILKSYTGDIIETIGYILVDVVCGTKSAKLKLHVVPNGGPPLMGRAWIKELKLSVIQCHNLCSEDSIALSLKEEYPEVFAEGLGTFKSRFRLRLKDDTPVFVKARALPLALREPVARELDRLQREGVIYKVDRSDYGTPIVPVVKSNGSIRICGDYKITLNPRLKDFHYPLPRIEDLFAALGGGEQYTKLDLSNAFQQCVLEDESQPMTAITTHMGTFVYRRVPFGIKCIPENFQKIMEETLSGLPSTAVFADDICVTGKDKSTHLSNLKAVLQRLKENGLRINWSKCKFFKDSVTYLGYKIDKFGLHTDDKKIEAIVAAPPPTNVSQLKSFMGLVNFYAKFCKNMSDILNPMYNLLKKNVKWNWDEKCMNAFIKIKKVLSSSPVLAHYDPNLPLILAVDSSPYGLGAVLLQRGADGAERPVCCASRTLAPAERNYAQIDKEALAIVFGVTKHHQYLYGRHFILRSDHRALSYIFGKNRGIPLTAASRLQRYAVKLCAYDFEIEFVRSIENCQADALSRLPLSSTSGRVKSETERCSYLNFIQENFPVSFKEIKTEIAKDPLLSRIYGYMVLKEIHDGHPGIVKMKQIARNYVYWDGLDADIERVSAQCTACVSQRPAPPAAPLHSWPWPAEPWSRLNIDFLGPFNNTYYLVIVDAHSKWIEVEKLQTISAAVVIGRLRQLFARFGLPKIIQSDNGPPMSSAEFGLYLKQNGIKHNLIAPYHPSSNGAAENSVRTIKRVLKKAVVEKMDDLTALSRFLFTYRNTEHSTTGREPAVAMFGRRLRGRLDLLRPDAAERVRAAQQAAERRTAPPHALREARPGDAVLIRDYARNSSKWAEGEVLERKSPVSYVVKAKDGRIQKRHIDQILTDKRKSRHSLALVAPIGEDTPSSMTNKPVETEQLEVGLADIGGGLVSNSVECEETKLPGLEETEDTTVGLVFPYWGVTVMFVVTVGLYGTEGLALTGRTARKKTSIKKHPEPQAAAHREGMHGITGVHHARAESRARGIRPALNMLVQVMTGHGCFGHYLYRVARREPTPLCYECGAADDTAQHTLEGCSKRGPQRRTLVAAIGGDLSLPSVVLAMLSSESASLAVPDFCEDVISQKEAAERVREEAPDAHPLRRRRVGRRRRQFEASQLLLPSQASLASYRRFTSFSTI
ncbi:uncharacterized protein K02A2.6-like [Pararge aegeria]|nr:uncharacterized protein K02A2.6-like [Pararge aegeria]